MKKDITLYYNAVCKEHSYDNGFCTKCGGYQPADYNESTGSYEIGNGGQMFWFAALVNGDGEHTQIQEAKPDAHGVLVSDISLKNPADENYEWKPIGEFKGIFDGQNHTISDFSMTKVNDQSIGFFQNLMSDPNETDETKKATLKNFTLNGTIVTTAEAASAVGGVVGTTSDSVIRRVNSNVNIGSGLIYYIGGIVGEINAATSIEESTYSGKIVLDYSFYGVGGIVGFVTDDDTYAGGTKIKDCANYGLITYYKWKITEDVVTAVESPDRLHWVKRISFFLIVTIMAVCLLKSGRRSMVQFPDTVRRRKMESRIIIISIHFR